MPLSDFEATQALLDEFGIKMPECYSSIGPGWHDLTRKLIKTLIELGWDKDLRQVKEKFGTLRFYVGKWNDDIKTAIIKAEERSREICETCGAPGKLIGEHWLLTRCENHDPNKAVHGGT